MSEKSKTRFGFDYENKPFLNVISVGFFLLQ